MAVLNLEDIDEAAENLYEPLEIPLGELGTVKLLHPNRLPKAKKEQLKKHYKTLNDLRKKYSTLIEEAEKNPDNLDDIDEDAVTKEIVTAYEKILLAVAHDPALGKQLVKKLAGNLDHLHVVFQNYSKVAQPGEASSSSA